MSALSIHEKSSFAMMTPKPGITNQNLQPSTVETREEILDGFFSFFFHFFFCKLCTKRKHKCKCKYKQTYLHNLHIASNVESMSDLIEWADINHDDMSANSHVKYEMLTPDMLIPAANDKKLKDTNLFDHIQIVLYSPFSIFFCFILSRLLIFLAFF